MNKLSTFATVDPNNGMNKNTPARCQNLVSGEWKDDDNEYNKIPDPLNGDNFILVPNTTDCLLYTSPSPRDAHESRMPSSA